MDAPEFFIDRSLGRRIVPNALREAGVTVHTMADVYGEQIGQQLTDETRPAEREALIAGGVRAFCLTNAQLRGEEQARRIVANLDGILRQAATPGPYIYGIYENRVRRLWPA